MKNWFKFLLGFTFVIVFTFTLSAFKAFKSMNSNTVEVTYRPSVVVTDITNNNAVQPAFDVGTGIIPEVIITADKPHKIIAKKYRDKKSCTIRRLSIPRTNIIDNINENYADSIPKLKPLTPIYIGRIQTAYKYLRLLPTQNLAITRPAFWPVSKAG